ncbi:hypothetical protein B0T26DRAFT_713824 [Lasiosphaeria miniovina]|uniref:Uncharacterized protein n=1 Tax=Lasiosphaeria miniovina TaxID=1954250 RepID=A0AA40AMM4_9PEZI|nr:uncharacterized protein B0T26DRAFT_713824 [Lasiosphaeria miniovina]KAK0718648.1 hypothetical protein B0T26DRAFT_713824 [Lasiosphaeria miniovina]
MWSLPGYKAQQDNAGPHASKWNKGFFAEHGIEEEKWPPNSADLYNRASLGDPKDEDNA